MSGFTGATGDSAVPNGGRRWRSQRAARRRWCPRRSPSRCIASGIALPFFFGDASGFVNATIIAIAYAVWRSG